MGLSPFFCHNGEALTTPPPAHCGIPPYQLDTKAIGEKHFKPNFYQHILKINISGLPEKHSSERFLINTNNKFMAT